MNQNRSLITHLDATELHRETSKPKRPVTMFLLADKILIAERPNYHTRGIDLLDVDGNNTKRNDNGFLMRNIKKDQCLKFRGWVDIEQIQLFKGAAGNISRSQHVYKSS